ncbi:MAG: SRPBCC family protein [Gammaproteobacteria bacterium]|nr:SRPBCC family protein [Gammaproteobacteria bacterium]
MRRRVASKRELWLASGAAIALAATVASTATLESIEVDRDGDTYSLHAETLMAAKPEAILEVLVDYERFGRISSVYKDYGYLEPAPDGTPIVFTRMEGCLLFYCKSMTRVERLEAASPAHIRTVTLPEQSDFKRSISEWFIEPEGTGSRMIYTLEMQPNFWVPPVIGPMILKRTLKRGGGDAIDRIERLAQEAEQQGN